MKKLSHEEFTSALAERLKADPIFIEDRLEDFIESFLATLKKENEVVIDGLGTFVLDKGTLSLKPDETLALEVNFKYAGMDAIEIMPAYVRKIQHEKKSDTDLDINKDTPLTPLQISKEEESESQDSVSDKLQDVTPIKPEPQKEKDTEENSASLEDPFNLEEPIEGKSNTEVANAKKEPVNLNKRSEKEKKQPVFQADLEKEQSKPSSNKLLYALAAMAAVMLVTMYIYQSGYMIPFDLPGNNTTNITHQNIQSDTQLPASRHELRQGNEPKENISDTENKDQASVSSATIKASLEIADPDKPEFGIRGEMAELAGRTFTIVVHSLPNYRMGSRERDKIRENGYRATLYSVTLDNGDETWRVGIGQFETIEDATEAIQKLDEPYKSSNFVARIR
ncbi:MAG: SPOR domain-containing protein [Balneolales bacterium]